MSRAIRRWLTALRRHLRRRRDVIMSSEPYGPLKLPWQELLRRSTERVPKP